VPVRRCAKKIRHYQQLLQQTRGLEVAAFAAGGEALDLKLRTVRRATLMVSPTAYDAGGAAGASLAINPKILET
jgi:predicted NodU family carbamoyl transferase